MSHTYESAPLKVCLMAMDWLESILKTDEISFFISFFFSDLRNICLSYMYTTAIYKMICSENVLRML